MACDEYFLNLTENKKINGILRLYTWFPVSISIGYFFKTNNLNIETINKKKINIVRRITGGNLILHDKDLTYSLILKKGIYKIQNKKEYYHFIANILKDALNDFQIQSKINTNIDFIENNPDCFNSISQYEISTNDGKKLIGSAQIILKNSLLQHGSFIYDYNPEKISNFLKMNTNIIKNIKYDNKYFISPMKLSNVFEKQFCNYFNLIKYKLSSVDNKNIKKLIIDKYSNNEWTFRK